MGFARKGEASAAGVLLERHPLETLPARLEALRWACHVHYCTVEAPM